MLLGLAFQHKTIVLTLSFDGKEILHLFCQFADLQDIASLHTKCPAITRRQGRVYQTAVHKLGSTSLQGETSDVELHIQEKCPKTAFLMDVKTDFSKPGEKFTLLSIRKFPMKVRDVFFREKTRHINGVWEMSWRSGKFV